MTCRQRATSAISSLCIGHGWDAVEKLGEMRQNARVDRVVFACRSDGTRKVAGLARIDYGDRQARRGQFSGLCDFSSRWLQA
jgi:stress response protein SCP2